MHVLVHATVIGIVVIVFLSSVVLSSSFVAGEAGRAQTSDSGAGGSVEPMWGMLPAVDMSDEAATKQALEQYARQPRSTLAQLVLRCLDNYPMARTFIATALACRAHAYQ